MLSFSLFSFSVLLPLGRVGFRKGWEIWEHMEGKHAS
jgi:hypothetical protein